MRIWRSAALSLLFLPALLAAQAPGAVDTRVFYYPKPLARTPWQPPMKPVTRLAEVKARHHAEPAWREPVIQDENSRAFLVQEPPGTTHARKLYPDSPAWWAVLDGRIRFEVEKARPHLRRLRSDERLVRVRPRADAALLRGRRRTSRRSDSR